MLMERAKLRIIPEEGEAAVDPNHSVMRSVYLWSLNAAMTSLILLINI